MVCDLIIRVNEDFLPIPLLYRIGEGKKINWWVGVVFVVCHRVQFNAVGWPGQVAIMENRRTLLSGKNQNIVAACF